MVTSRQCIVLECYSVICTRCSHVFDAACSMTNETGMPSAGVAQCGMEVRVKSGNANRSLHFLSSDLFVPYHCRKAALN